MGAGHGVPFVTAPGRTGAPGSPEEAAIPTNIAGPTSSLSPGFVLAARGKTHGPFASQAATAQIIKEAMYGAGRWCDLDRTHREVLEMIATKISRILEGDPEHTDSWLDIAGYAQLIVNHIEDRKENTRW